MLEQLHYRLSFLLRSPTVVSHLRLVHQAHALPSLLSAAASLPLGLQLHALALRLGSLACPFVRCSLVHLYSRCGDFSAAVAAVLEGGSGGGRYLSSWNALLGCCVRAGRVGDARWVFVEMRRRGMGLDEFGFPSAVNAAALSGDAEGGRGLHCAVLVAGFDGFVHVGNALVDMYAKFGMFECAGKVFDGMPERDVVTWTSLLVALSQRGLFDEAVGLYSEMRTRGVGADEFVVAGVLSSCAGSTRLELGRLVHSFAAQLGFDSFLSVSNALVTMYAKSGCIDSAKMAFDTALVRDAITWTALIVGYAQNGLGKMSLELYDEMIQSGEKPDYVTFIGLLFACSHTGLVEQGQAFFKSMKTDYNITPRLRHYACMIDLLGRANRLDEAVQLVHQMHIEPDATIWKTLLAACRIHKDVKLAEWAADRAYKSQPADGVPLVMLSNLYSSIGQWDDMARIRTLVKAENARKEPGCSWIEAEGIINMFYVRDRGHKQANEIYEKVSEMLERIQRQEGYVPDTNWAMHDVDEEGKGFDLAYHCEKLAVAFGLINMPLGKPIRVYKNLRVCGDCHTVIKLVAKVYDRKIVLRDSNCFHHMSEGVCCCGDYW